jgi:archaeal type IV pilus assembly protein PilA
MTHNQDEDAVSPVIGVILMVAITVILAAVIASYVFGMTAIIPSGRNVVATVSQPDSSHITVVYKGGPDQTLVKGLNITWPSGVTQSFANPVVGSSFSTTGQFAGKDHVVVVASFNDGTDQVILDAYI